MKHLLKLFSVSAGFLICHFAAAAGPAPALSAAPASSLHKIQLEDPSAGPEIVRAGGRLLADYGAYQLYEVPGLASDVTPPPAAENRDTYNVIELNAGGLDTHKPEVQALRASVGNFSGRRLHLVQFVGPVQRQWREELIAAGAQIVAYIPQNSYLLYGDAASLSQVQKLAASAPHIQWEGAFQDAYKIHPSARATDKNGNPSVASGDRFAIQLVADPEANPNTEQLLSQLQLEPPQQRRSVLHYLNFVVRLNPQDLALIAAQPDVVSIQPYVQPRKFDERQDQIIAGNLSGNLPSGPGYLAWLASKGFTQAQFTASDFAVDVSDSGVDNGSTLPNHFGLYQAGTFGGVSRVSYNRLAGTPNPSSTLHGCDGHGNLNAHIIGGFDDLAGFPFADSSGYHYGLGVCPFVKLGSSVIFDPDNFTNPNYNNLQAQAYQSGARISNNSWGADTGGAYDTDAQNYDALVRDAQPAGSSFPAAGNQEMVIVFAAGNAGSGAQTVGSPGTAKNVITVGAGENVQPFGGADGSGIADNQANSANDIASFSSRGPCTDGRRKPEITAPGTHVSGGVAQADSPSATGTADPCFTGFGVSGGVGSNYFPPGQQFYTASSGTSHSTPCVAGACALLRQYFINNFTNPPSPAMTKAYLMNSARYMTGLSANDTLPSNNQGVGELNLGTGFDGTPRVLRDQVPADFFTTSGQTRTFTGVIGDTNKPYRVSLAWTDAPGSTAGNAYNNNLDLTVTVGGATYKGNVFNGAFSVTGGSADLKNNAESVFLPAGVSGNFVVKVTGTGINSIGVPNSTNGLLQDFALVIYNGSLVQSPVISLASTSLVAEACSPTNGVIDPGETVSVNFGLQNLGSGSTTNLVATLLATGGISAPSAPQTYGALAPAGAAVVLPFSFTANGTCGGTVTATIQLQDGSVNLGVINVNFPLGKAVVAPSLLQNFDTVTPPALPSGWIASASGSQSPWVTSSSARDTLPNSAFATDAPAAGLTELTSPSIPIALPIAQLTFRNNYNLESTYDGGVLEIKVGTGAFTDILTAGGSFVTGGYNSAINASYGNPLAGRAAWSGNSGGFINTTVNLPPSAAGQNIQFKWRCGSDSSVSAPGWYIDTLSIVDGYFSCCSGLVAPTLSSPRLSGGNLLFSFQTVNGQAYRVEYKPALTAPSWSTVQTFTGDGSLRTITNALSSPQGFFRLASP